MPWCPNCKMEYRKGMTVCSDCNIELVEELPTEEEFVPFYQAETKEEAQKLMDYFSYSELTSSLHYDEENEVHVVSVPNKQQNKAKKLYQAFFIVEHSDMKQESSEPGRSEQSNVLSDMEEDSPTGVSETDEHSLSESEVPIGFDAESPAVAYADSNRDTTAAYVMKADQYKDLSSTVYIFSFFGIAGVIFVILNITGVLHIYSGLLPNIVMAALFLFFLYVGISTNQKAKTVKSEIEKENALTKEINQWLQDNITEDLIASYKSSDISDELNYLKITEIIKTQLLQEFGNQNMAYLDRLVEEFYIENFE